MMGGAEKLRGVDTEREEILLSFFKSVHAHEFNGHFKGRSQRILFEWVTFELKMSWPYEDLRT